MSENQEDIRKAIEEMRPNAEASGMSILPRESMAQYDYLASSGNRDVARMSDNLSERAEQQDQRPIDEEISSQLTPIDAAEQFYLQVHSKVFDLSSQNSDVHGWNTVYDYETSTEFGEPVVLAVPEKQPEGRMIAFPDCLFFSCGVSENAAVHIVDIIEKTWNAWRRDKPIPVTVVLCTTLSRMEDVTHLWNTLLPLVEQKPPIDVAVFIPQVEAEQYPGNFSKLKAELTQRSIVVETGSDES